MKRHIPLPLTPVSNDHLYGTWRRFATIPESGSCFYYNKPDLLYRIAQLRDDPRLSAKYLKGMTLHIIDADSILDDESQANWDAAFQPVKKGQKNALVMILGMERYLQTGNRMVFHNLMRREIELETVSILLFFLTDFLHPQYVSVFDTASAWIRNTVRFPLHSPDDTRSYLDHQSAMWNMKLSSVMRDKITKTTAGGNFFLPKEALRYLRDNPYCSEVDLFHHPEMTLRLDIIWRQLQPSEQSVVKKIRTGIAITDTIEKHSLEFLTDIGWINKINGRSIIAIPLMAEYIAKTLPPIQLSISQTHQILLQGVPIDANFSKTEKRLLTEFILHRNTDLSRDRIAQIIGSTEDYNDWTIDKSISRLRKKMTLLGIPATTLKTVHGKGFIFQIPTI